MKSCDILDECAVIAAAVLLCDSEQRLKLIDCRWPTTDHRMIDRRPIDSRSLSPDYHLHCHLLHIPTELTFVLLLVRCTSCILCGVDHVPATKLTFRNCGQVACELGDDAVAVFIADRICRCGQRKPHDPKPQAETVDVPGVHSPIALLRSAHRPPSAANSTAMPASV